MKRLLVSFFAVGLLLAIAVIFISNPAWATPVITQDNAFIEDRPPDDIYGHSGLFLTLAVNATDAGGTSALTGSGSSTTAVSSNLSFPFAQPVNMPVNVYYPISGGAQFVSLQLLTGSSQFPDVTGTYTFTVTNTSSQSTVSTSNNLDKPEVIPLPTSLTISNKTTTPVFTFTDPNPVPGLAGLNREYKMNIFDSTKTLIYTSALSLTPTFTVPSGILQVGNQYFFRAESDDFATTPALAPATKLQNRADEYATFTPTSVPEPSTLIFLGSGLIGLVGLRRKFKK